MHHDPKKWLHGEVGCVGNSFCFSRKCACSLPICLTVCCVFVASYVVGDLGQVSELQLVAPVLVLSMLCRILPDIALCHNTLTVLAQVSHLVLYSVSLPVFLWKPFFSLLSINLFFFFFNFLLLLMSCVTFHFLVVHHFHWWQCSCTSHLFWVLMWL